MNIREQAPLTNRPKYYRIPPRKIKHKVVIDSKKLVFPFLKENIGDENNNKNQKDNSFLPKIKNSKDYKENIISIDYLNKNIITPIVTDLCRNKKIYKKVIEEQNVKKKSQLKEAYSHSHMNIKVKKVENTINKISSNLNIFNKNQKKSNIKIDFFQALSNEKNKTKLKFPIIDKNYYNIKSDKKISKKILNRDNYKLKSETILIGEFNIGGKNCATYTRKGTEDNGKEKENNQDASIILEKVLQIEDYSIYGIMDGHGSNGHLVSNFVKEKVKEYFNDIKTYKIKKLARALSELEITNSNIIYEKLKYNDYKIIRNFYKKVNEELYNTKFDVHFSGTTCILVFKLGQKIICSNVGDSRAILVKRKNNLNSNKDSNNFNYEFIELSHDHKPENKEERERIEKAGGEVAQQYLLGNEEQAIGPFRVWNKGCDYPGIAISRSLGDKIAELIGVISDPDILELNLDDKSKYIIMGSDGVFEYLSNKDIIDISGDSLIKNNIDKSCLDIIEKAAELFKEKEKRIDDITINIIIL